MPAAVTRARLQLAIVLAIVVGYQVYAVFVRRSGEAAYLPPASETHLSPEIAGSVALEQSFVMRVDDLDSIRVFPHPSTATPEGTVQFVLTTEGYTEPIAKLTRPATTVAEGGPFAWELPRVAQAAERRFILRIAIPDARGGHGLRFEVGTPHYIYGELAIGPRSFWGDLKFETRAGRARFVRSLADLRKQAPPLLRSDAVLIGAVVLFDWAIISLVLGLIRARSTPDTA